MLAFWASSLLAREKVRSTQRLADALAAGRSGVFVGHAA
jgi:hypothetical protein